MTAQDTEAFVIAVSNAVGSQPVRDEAFSVRLDQGAGFGGDDLVEFNLGVEVPALEEYFIEARVAERALEGLLASRVFLGGGFTAAAGAFVADAFLLKTDGFTDGFGSGVSGAPHVIGRAFVFSEVVEVVQVLSRGGSVGFERLQGILLSLWMRIAQGGWRQGLHGGIRVSAEGRQFADGRSGKTANLGRWHREQAHQLRQGTCISTAAQGESALHGLMVDLLVHVAVHGGRSLVTSASGSESVGVCGTVA